METYRIIASSGQAIFQGKQQNYVMLTGLSINFHLHYLDALKNLIAIAVVISLLIVLIIRIAVRQGTCPFVMSAMPLKTSPPRILMRGWNRHAFPLSWSSWLSLFNHMIGKIEDVLPAVPILSADIAHEIRTPITNLVTQTEIALESGSNPEGNP